eukprot:scaffold6899_cov183-Amphora_coffeaeformis.AAC.35
MAPIYRPFTRLAFALFSARTSIASVWYNTHPYQRSTPTLLSKTEGTDIRDRSRTRIPTSAGDV